METILEAGWEGGSITLQGRRTGDSWVFVVVKDERTMLDVLPGEFTEDGLYSERGGLLTWDAALEALDCHSWAHRFPMEIHPNFAERIMEAASERLGDEHKDQLDRWRRVVNRQLRVLK